jgi:hypothetical protein
MHTKIMLFRMHYYIKKDNFYNFQSYLIKNQMQI